MTAPPLALFDLAEAVGRWVWWAVINAINGLIAALGAVLSGIEMLFPELPDVPEPPAGNDGFIGALSWVFPWGGLLVVMTSAAVIWIAFLGLRVIAKWVKAL